MALGSAAAASVAAGIYNSIQEAAAAMVRKKRVFDLDLRNMQMYEGFVGQYIATYEHLREDSHRLVELASATQEQAR